MLLAARGLGLASVLTTRPRRGFESEIKEKLGIPANVDTAALLPLGYPAAGKRYGPTTRRPVEEVTFDETWGRPWSAT
jgi:nitroreductase